MSGKIELNISEFTLERLRCSICEGYLSCPPIRILPDGSTICGRCSPLDKDAPTYVQFTLEAIMRDATFPCKFSQHGCEARLMFGYTSTISHEAECAYRDGTPKSPKADTCSDESTEPEPSQMVNEKSTFVLRDAELTVKVDRKEEGVSVENDSSVINPYSIHNRRNSNAPSVVSLRNWNGINPPPRSTRANSWNGDFNNSFGRNNYTHRNNWYNMAQHERWNYNSYNNRFGYRRRPYHNKRKNNLVIIKGHTLYVTL